MLEHYRELFRLFRGSILWGMTVAGLFACGLSMFLLKFMPLYAATVTLNMQPSEEALRFNRQFVGVGQFNPATIITQTHIERLLSDPVTERAFDILLSKVEGDPPVDEPNMIDEFKTLAWTWWAKLNYGFYTAQDTRTEHLNAVRNAVSVDFVEGSYIIRLEATSRYPELAARIANAYATAYTEIASDDFLDQVFNSTKIVEDKILAKDEELRAVLDQREELRDELDVNDIGRELSVLLETRREALVSLQDAQIVLAKMNNELEFQLRTLGNRAVGSEGTLELQRRKIADQEDEIAFRERVLEDLDEQLNGLGTKERRLANLTNSIVAAEQDLQILRERLVSLDLSTNARMSQVRVVSPAKPSIYPDFPKVFLNTAFAPFVGGLLVLVVLVLSDAIGSRVRTQADLQNIVGPRALPTITPRLRSRFGEGRFNGGRAAKRIMKTFANTLGHRMSTDAGLSTQTVVVTGFLGEDEIAQAAKIIKEAIGSISNPSETEDQIQVVTAPPVSAIVNWDDLPNGSVVVVVPANIVDDLVLTAMQSLGNRNTRKPFMLIWS